MADDEIATRAPESDAQEDKQENATSNASPFPGDTPAQTGPTMGEHCTTDRPLPSSDTTVKGEISSINGISCYISKPSEYPSSPSKLLLLLSSGTGIESQNNQLQADMYADRGYVVVMPDQFAGDPAPGAAATITPSSSGNNDSIPQSPSSAPSLLERFKLGAAETAKSFLIDMWLAKHTPVKIMPILQKTLEGAREEFADAVANGGGIYGVGYCFGAKYIMLLCGEHGDSVKAGQKEPGDEEKGEVTKGPELKAGAIAHGTSITKEDIEGIKSPIAMACVENDQLFPDNVREQGRAALELNNVTHDIKVFSGVPHGFAVLGDYADDSIKQKQKEAFSMMVEWLDAH